ncbi:MAG: phenazine biosynthesis protein PhzF [Acidocella sp. 20-61-6]|nr:MAG: phenazine biosynthesis protein PhzF [Acidocella sp. 20-61-6]
MSEFDFAQVDVFTATPLKGNPLAVVLAAEALSTEQMAGFANWTNLSETSFLLPPTRPEADYRVRIFTPGAELPFAGHPTLGSAHVWLAAGGKPKGAEIIQECPAGLIRIRRDGARLAFAAPPVTQGEVEPDTLARIAASLRIRPADIRDACILSEYAPAWIGVLLADREAVLALQPDGAAMGELEIGVVGPGEGETQFEVRGFFAPDGGMREDPVTGSLNGGLARWLIGAGIAPARYVAAQGTCIGRAGRIHVRQEGADFWIGGDVVTCITGRLAL